MLEKITFNVCCILFMAAMIANLVHWNGQPSEKCIYPSTHRWVNAMDIICGVLVLLLMALWLLGVDRSNFGGDLALFWMAWNQACSLWFRMRERRCHP